VPGMLLDDQSLVTTQHNVSVETRLARAAHMHWDGVKAMAEFEQSQALKQAIQRKTATLSNMDLLPGQRCAYWRDARKLKGAGRKAGETSKPGYILATFMMYDMGKETGEGVVKYDRTNAWVAHKGRCIQVSLEQLRPAVGFEEWHPTAAELLELRKAEQSLREGQQADERHEGPPEHEPLIPDLMPADIAYAALAPLPLLLEAGGVAIPAPGVDSLEDLVMLETAESETGQSILSHAVARPDEMDLSLRSKRAASEDSEDQGHGSRHASSSPCPPTPL
jgi:hypothetical protein